MDLLLLLMGLTLLTAGWFLVWEFARFLHCAYSIQGRVVSMEPGYGVHKHIHGPDAKSFSFFPVIQYEWMGEPTRFTSLDSKCIVGLQIGDQVKLSFSRTRRTEARIGRMVMILVLSMAVLVAGMFSAGVLIRENLDMAHMLLGSLVLAVCLFIIILYIRQQDETIPSTRYPQAQSQSQTNVFILEPTNVCYWKRLFTNRSQRRRILFSKVIGFCCLTIGSLMFVTSIWWTDQRSEGSQAAGGQDSGVAPANTGRVSLQGSTWSRRGPLPQREPTPAQPGPAQSDGMPPSLARPDNMPPDLARPESASPREIGSDADSTASEEPVQRDEESHPFRLPAGSPQELQQPTGTMPSAVGPRQVGPRQVGPREVGPSEVGPREAHQEAAEHLPSNAWSG